MILLSFKIIDCKFLLRAIALFWYYFTNKLFGNSYILLLLAEKYLSFYNI